MRIGITERGDAGLDFAWVDKIKNNKVDAAVLITKNLNDKFINTALSLHEEGHKFIIPADAPVGAKLSWSQMYRNTSIR